MKLNLLFVDDEPNVVFGLKRMLRPLRNEWNFHFALSGEEALDILDVTNIDIVVSDMKMPNMNGEELLRRVKEKYPSVIRFILSGHSDMDLSLKASRIVHQFISKPIEAEQLKDKISKSYKLFKILENEHLRKIINGIGTLPPMPETYFKLEKALLRDDFSLKIVSQIINEDSVMAAKVLQLVNSAFFGLPTNISDVDAAVNYLGANTIKSLILYVNVFSTFENNTRIQDLLKEIWVHSLKVATDSKKIILKFSKNPGGANTAYTAGLLHDIGKIIVLNNEEYRNDIFERKNKNNLTYDTAEYQVLQTSHAEIGGYILSLWGLPEIIVEAVLFHHSVQRNPVIDFDVVTSVYIANAFSNHPNVEIDYLKKIISEELFNKIFNICSEQ